MASVNSWHEMQWPGQKPWDGSDSPKRILVGSVRTYFFLTPCGCETARFSWLQEKMQHRGLLCQPDLGSLLCAVSGSKKQTSPRQISSSEKEEQSLSLLLFSLYLFPPLTLENQQPLVVNCWLKLTLGECFKNTHSRPGISLADQFI